MRLTKPESNCPAKRLQSFMIFLGLPRRTTLTKGLEHQGSSNTSDNNRKDQRVSREGLMKDLAGFSRDLPFNLLIDISLKPSAF